jgi:hypothetical protein
VGGEEPPDVLGRRPEQVPREPVDQRVERLERDALALVGAAEDDDRPRTLAELAEPREEGALAHARGSRDVDEVRGPRADVVERRLERREFSRAALEPRPPIRWTRGPARALEAQEGRDLGRVGPSLGVHGEQAHGELVEVVRDPHDQLGGARGERVLLREEDRHRCPFERERARERLVEHRPDRVAVGGGRERSGQGLLRRHVGRGPARALPVGEVKSAALHRLGDAEIEDDDAIVFGDEDVGRLDVAVEHARRVERGEPVDELTQELPEPLEVPDGRGRAHARDRGDDGRAGVALGGAGRRAGPRPPDDELGRAVDEGELQPRLGGDRRRHGGAPVASRAPPDPGGEGHPVDEIHREEPVGADPNELVAEHDVRVCELGDGAELLLELEDAGGVHLVERLERDVRTPKLVPRPVDHAHATGADAGLDAEAVVAREWLFDARVTHDPFPGRRLPRGLHHARARSGSLGAWNRPQGRRRLRSPPSSATWPTSIPRAPA